MTTETNRNASRSESKRQQADQQEDSEYEQDRSADPGSSQYEQGFTDKQISQGDQEEEEKVHKRKYVRKGIKKVEKKKPTKKSQSSRQQTNGMQKVTTRSQKKLREQKQDQKVAPVKTIRAQRANGVLQKAPKKIQQIKPLVPLNDQKYTQLQASIAAPTFDLCYEAHLGKVLDVYDGDTLIVVILFNGMLRKFRVRVLEIDAPQLKDSNPKISEYAQRVRDILASKIKGRIVKLECGKFDRYGSLLAHIFLKPITGADIKLSEFMLSNMMAKQYSEKTKDPFTVQDYNRAKYRLARAKLPELIDYPNPMP